MKKIKTLNLILIIIAVFVVAFVAVMCWFFYKFQSVPDTLITAVLVNSIAELGFTALIEVAKKKFDKGSETNDNIQNE